MRLLSLLLVCCLAALAYGETIDRVVAKVNGRPVLESDVDETVRYEALMEGKPLEGVTSTDVHATLDRLIDQELLRQQMTTMAPETDGEALNKKLSEIRQQQAATAEQWREKLAAYGITEEIFTTRLENQMRTMAFLDSRLRPSIVIDRNAVEAYYRDNFLPQLHKSGATPDPPLADVQQEIREILTQQRIDDMLVTWLRNLRQQSNVSIIGEEPRAADSGVSNQTAK